MVYIILFLNTFKTKPNMFFKAINNYLKNCKTYGQRKSLINYIDTEKMTATTCIKCLHRERFNQKANCIFIARVHGAAPNIGFLNHNLELLKTFFVN
ncbi:hypothetical protein H312_02853 [Anncaliia algerae PRA339]|uniref:Uncharacterized protein n=1 Tax=Anncaliia algerae PRA339 TaxID=1288291 RepID=A0A059EXW2_9MICR|nr:hypothetical protein H312_02853 [Anncaliia algerae PRA339]